MRFLIVDIGAGTMDILYYDTQTGMHYKTVAKSPIQTMAERAASLSGNLLITGIEMGGGPLSRILQDRAKAFDVVMSASAASTIHHNHEKVSSLGITVVDDREAEEFRHDGSYNRLNICDIEEERLREIVHGLGLPFSFDVVGICAQDHGVPPEGISHLDYRHHLFKASMDKRPFPHMLLYRDDEVSTTLNRLRSIAESARRLPTGEIYVMDSGMAAIIGASMDPRVRSKDKILVLDVATSHTIGAAMDRGELAGFFEYHTRDITLQRLEYLIKELAEGNLRHEEILKEGGHGAYIRKKIGFGAVNHIVVTGPKRGLVKGSQLPIVFGAPFGDNMMTGTVGVLEAIRRRKALEPISYL